MLSVVNIADRPAPGFAKNEVTTLQPFFAKYIKHGTGMPPLTFEEELDWDEILALVLYYRVLGSFYQTCGEVIPQENKATFDLVHHNMVRRIDLALKEATRLTALFATNGIKSVVVKGAGLGQTIHGDTYLRNSGDLDILAEELFLPQVHQILMQCGYQQSLADFFAEKKNVPNTFLPFFHYKTTPRLLSDYRQSFDGINFSIEVHSSFRGISNDKVYRLISNASDLPFNGGERAVFFESAQPSSFSGGQAQRPDERAHISGA